MANTTVHVTTLTKNDDAALPAGTAIVPANTHVITPTKPVRQGLIVIQHTTAAAKTGTVLAGDSPPALSAGRGNLSFDLEDATAGTTTRIIGPIDAGRFLQSDGNIHVTVAADTTGTIEYIELP